MTKLDCVCCGETFDKQHLDSDGVCDICNREDEMECDDCCMPFDECLCDEDDYLDDNSDDDFIYGFADEDLDDEDDFYDQTDDWEGDDWEDDDEDDEW